MAISTARATSLFRGTFKGIVTCSGQADGWVTIHNDVSSTVTAETAAVLLRPLSATTSSIIPAKILHPVSRVILRLRYPQAVAIATTQPVVRLYSIFGEPIGGAFPDDGTVHFMRLDAQAATTAGLTLTVGSNTADLRDTTFCYSNPSSLAGMDLQCGRYVIALVETAGVITTGSGTIQLQALFQN